MDGLFDTPPHPWRKNEGYGSAVPNEAQWRAALVGYYSAVNEIDDGVGRIVASIAAAGRLDRTVFIYVSDHGCSLGQNGFFGKGNSTRPLNMYDVSLRVPLIISGPNLPDGRTIDRCTDHYDLFQTLLAIASVAAPTGRDYPGRSLLPLVRGESADWDDTRYGEYGDLRMIRTPDAKLVQRQPNGPDELFDLARDPGETTPVPPAAGDSRHEQLADRLKRWHALHETPEKSGMRSASLPRHNLSSEAWRDGLRDAAPPA